MNINSLKIKLLLVTMIPFILGIYILSGINIKKTESTLNLTLDKFEKSITREKEALIKNEFDVVESLIKTVLADEKDIQIAKEKVIQLLSGIRYLDDKSGYFFAYEKRDEDYYFAFHPTRKNLNDTKANVKAPDVKGYAFREDLIKYAKERKYIKYHYENPSTKEVLLKMASSIYIPEFNWILVTGIYADEIQKEIDILKTEVESNMDSLFDTIILLTILLSLLLVAFIVPFMTKILIKPLNTFQYSLEGFFKYLNREVNEVRMINKYSKDEIGQMSKVLDTNIEKAKKNFDDNNIFIDETIKILAKFQNGDLSQRLNMKVDDINLTKLESVMNKMAEELEHNIVKALDVIDEYSQYKYTSKVSTKNLSNHLLKLAEGINILGDSIKTMLSENKENGNTLTNSSNILLKNVEDLDESSRSTVKNLEETTTSLDKMTANLRLSTKNVQKMSNIASGVTGQSQEGKRLANDTVEAMREINSQITLINEAISVIDKIAFQTNILSLNAAVESATAGEAGKGFAVVAQEVRNLANRSAQAAKEIKEIVEIATLKAKNGELIASEMINGYSQLNKNILETIDLIKDFENSSKEQLLEIEQINNAVSILENKTQENAKVTLQTKQAALTTDKIAKLIIEDVNKKEF